MFHRIRLDRAVYLAVMAATTMLFQNCGVPQSAGISSSNISGGSRNGGVTPTSVPRAPNQLTAQAIAARQVKLTWVDNSTNESGFRIERSSPVSGPFTSGPGDFLPVQTVAAGVTTYNDGGLLPSTNYFYRISAINSVGASAVSASVSVTTPAAPVSAPSPPSNLTANATSATIIQLRWNDNSNNEYGFKIDQSVNAGATFTQIATAGADETAFQVTNLNPSTAYTFRVRATNNVGDSANTANATVSTPAAVNTASFNYVFTNIIGPNCAGCHGAVSPAGGINLSNYASVFANRNRAYTAIIGGRMPPGGALAQAQINAFKAWIDSGAPNN